MDNNRQKSTMYSASWVENYLDGLIADHPVHKPLLDSYLLVSDAVRQLMRENSELQRKIDAVKQALGV